MSEIELPWILVIVLSALVLALTISFIYWIKYRKVEKIENDYETPTDTESMTADQLIENLMKKNS